MTTVSAQAPELRRDAVTTHAKALQRDRVGAGRTRARLRPVGLLVLLTVLFGVVLLSLAVGTRAVPLDDVVRVLLHPDGGEQTTVVRSLRVPRTVLGLVVGLALGVAGVVLQGLTRNPLADPGVLGIAPGAALAAVIGFRVGLSAPWQTALLAAAGAAVAGTMVSALGSRGRGGSTPVTLALAGVSTSFLLSALISAIVLLDAPTLDDYRFWNVGSLSGRSTDLLPGAAPLLVLGLVFAVVAARPLDLLALGDDAARNLGVSVGRARLSAAAAAVLLVGAATALSGPLAFVGLVVPHLARSVTGPDHRWLLAYAVMLGPLLVLLADVVGRVVVRPAELQTGIVVVAVGAPVFILLARRVKAVGL